MVWAWMRWSSNSLKDERYSGMGMDALVIEFIERRALLWFGHGCSGNHTHLVHKLSC